MDSLRRRFMSPMRILLSLWCVLLAAPLDAQPRGGTLRLVVRDATDLTIPGAAVTITAGDGQTQTITSNESGEARIDGLAPGVYLAHIESPGFTPLDVKDLRVRAGAQTS